MNGHFWLTFVNSSSCPGQKKLFLFLRLFHVLIIAFFCCRAGNEPFTDNTEILENGVIRFMSVTGAEQGAYICTAENGMGTITVTANLRIQGKHTNWKDIDTREVMPPGGTHSIRLGNQTIFCGPGETAHALP